jgi:hypothetical protein
MMYERLPDEIKTVLENGVPAELVSCSMDGVPNTTVLSQVYYVDPESVALSFQFFNKTVRNIRENPHACVLLNDVEGYAAWILKLRYDHSETEGPVFEDMDVQIEAIASATGMTGVFKLKAADIYRVESVKKVDFEPAPEG